MAVYNGEATLRETLQCLVQQRYKDFELVVVNDESQDGSAGIIQSFMKENPQIPVQYIRQKNKGLGGARNVGIQSARGLFLSLLDQDDIWYPKKLEKVALVFKDHPDVSFVTHHLYRRVGGQIRDELHCGSVVSNVFQKLLFEDNYFCGSAMSFRKEVLNKIGVFNEDRLQFHMTEDYDYWLRGASKNLKFFVLEEALGEYVVHTKNFSKNRLLMHRNEWNVVWKHYRQRPVRQWSDPLKLIKRRGKILARQVLNWVFL